MVAGVYEVEKALSAPAAAIVGNPSFSYFSSVYRKPTKFATQFVSVPFDTATGTSLPYFGTKTLTINSLARVGDLLLGAHLAFDLPDIYSDDTSRFQWIDKVGTTIVQEVRVSIGGQLIERIPGEWIDVWSELSHSPPQRELLDRLTGNVDTLKAPVSPLGATALRNNEYIYLTYPVGNRATRAPSISGRRIYVPLPLWFSRTPGHALPLIALQGAPVKIEIDVRPWSQLYRLWDQFSRTYYAPERYPAGQASDNGQYANTSTPQLYAYLESPDASRSSVDLNAFLECEFGFLGVPERTSVAVTSRETLIETVSAVRVTGLSGTGTVAVPLPFNEPTKELVWILRREDVLANNDFTNLTAATTASDAAPALQSATLYLNGQERMDFKSAAFFDTLQPLQYHTGAPRSGVYVWSFALTPERMTPSGFLDLATYKTVELRLNLSPLPDGGTYRLDVFATTLNFLSVINGTANKKYV